MAGALLGVGQAGVGQAQQRSVAVHRHYLAEGTAGRAGPGRIDG
jgi:hypothetical protein